MKTQKRFTPALLEQYTRLGRGTGTYQSYIPWHRVGRSDPSSDGRSHLLIWRERQRELLSDGEWNGILFSTMLPHLEDVLEQYPLSTAPGEFELAKYDIRFTGKICPGTVAIAAELGIKHPKINGDGRSEHWTMSTDQVLVFKSPLNLPSLLAVAYKPSVSSLSKRERDLLAIEKSYWAYRGIQWLLITSGAYEKSVGLTLRRCASWGLDTLASPTEISLAVQVHKVASERSYSYVIDTLTARLGDQGCAQRAFWQAVWYGYLPMDLRRGWRPHLPIRLLTADAFNALNPIAARRSSWI